MVNSVRDWARRLKGWAAMWQWGRGSVIGGRAGLGYCRGREIIVGLQSTTSGRSVSGCEDPGG